MIVPFTSYPGPSPAAAASVVPCAATRSSSIPSTDHGTFGVVPGAGGEDVLQQLDIDGPQSVRRAVLVADGTLARHALGHRVELRLELVVRPLLPVVRARRAGPAPGPAVQGQLVPLQHRQRHGPGRRRPIAAAPGGGGRRRRGSVPAGTGREEHCQDEAPEGGAGNDRTDHGNSDQGVRSGLCARARDDALTTAGGQAWVSAGRARTSGVRPDRAGLLSQAAARGVGTPH